MTLHLVKLCVGVREPKELTQWQKQRRAERRAKGGPDGTFHVTRNTPKRGEEIAAGGSLYWVMAGVIKARQRITGFKSITDKDGTPRCRIMLHSKVVPVVPTPMRAFQGWRYLEEKDAPRDLATLGKEAAKLPPKMVAELRALGLL
jgi:hypothetical protein